MSDQEPTEKRCDIIVPTFNKLEHTETFVKSFLAHTIVPARVIFVDNGSTDGTRDFLASLRDTDQHSFTVILNRENRGYAAAMNQGIAVSKAGLVCFCNNDVVFTHGWLDEAILTFNEHPKVGLLNPNSNNLNTHPGEGESIDELAERLKKSHPKGAFIDMPFCIGFCMLVTRAVLDAVGGFDEAFAPMYFEDSDYSRRVCKAGYHLGIACRSYVSHEGHGSSAQLKGKAEDYFRKSREVYLKKWGETLRIAWIIDDYQQLLDELDKAVGIGRDANFIWFWVRHLEKERDEIFKEAGVPPFTDAKFIPFEKYLLPIWKVLTKKKKYDLVITANPKIRQVLNLIGQTNAEKLDLAMIQELKFKGIKRLS